MSSAQLLELVATLQGLRDLSGPRTRVVGACDPLPPRALGDTRWPDHHSAIARGNQGPFRSRPAPLRADALPHGSNNIAAPDGAVAVGGPGDLQTTDPAAADRAAGWLS